MKKIFIVLLLVSTVFIYSCRKENKEVESLMSEINTKEEELNKVGIPSFLEEEQRKLFETNTNLFIPKEVYTNEFQMITKTDSVKKTKKSNLNETEEIPLDTMQTKDIYNETLVSQKTNRITVVKPSEKYTKNQSKFFNKVSTKSLSKVSVTGKHVNKVKLYFSYRNGVRYIDPSYPGKITTVVYVNKNVWYVDYNVYAIPFSKVKNYKKYLTSSYLVGIGRNISVVDGRSQLTVYWSGINVGKSKMANGKYAIVVHVIFKNSSKKVISSKVKVLGEPNYLVVILAR